MGVFGKRGLLTLLVGGMVSSMAMATSWAEISLDWKMEGSTARVAIETADAEWSVAKVLCEVVHSAWVVCTSVDTFPPGMILIFK